MKTKALLIVAAKFYGVHVDIEIVADPESAIQGRHSVS